MTAVRAVAPIPDDLPTLRVGAGVNAANFSLKALVAMAHSPVRNYAIPGLTSWLIGAPSKHGTVRLFECERAHQEPITPHSHRFDFQCWVLSGSVRNRLWRATYSGNPNADFFMSSLLCYRGDMGKYEKSELGPGRYVFDDLVHAAGECYAMQAREIHSIYFSRGARVLFFEGPKVLETSVILEPWVDGETVPTFSVEPWMFKRAAIAPEVDRTSGAGATAQTTSEDQSNV